MDSDGDIAGAATQTGDWPVTITVTDANGITATTTLVLDVTEPPPTPLSSNGDGSGSAAGLTWGDPHLVTFDGATYNFQQVGEFILRNRP